MTWYLSYRIAFLVAFGLLMWVTMRYSDPLAGHAGDEPEPDAPAALAPSRAA